MDTTFDVVVPVVLLAPDHEPLAVQLDGELVDDHLMFVLPFAATEYESAINVTTGAGCTVAFTVTDFLALVFTPLEQTSS